MLVIAGVIAQPFIWEYRTMVSLSSQPSKALADLHVELHVLAHLMFMPWAFCTQSNLVCSFCVTLLSVAQRLTGQAHAKQTCCVMTTATDDMA